MAGYILSSVSARCRTIASLVQLTFTWRKGSTQLLAFLIAVVVVQPTLAFAQESKDSGVAAPNALPGCGQGDPRPPTFPGPPTPVKSSFAASPGGVDMRSGAYNYENADLSIGGGDGSGLTLTRIFAYDDPANPIGQGFGEFFSHNWDIGIRQTRVPIAGACYPNKYAYSTTVQFGSLGEGFYSNYSPIEFQQTAANGYAELTVQGGLPSGGTYTFTA